MAMKLSTDSLDINDGSTYYLVYFGWGDPNREEVWLEPYGASEPIMASRHDRKRRARITLAVKGSSISNLVTAINNVRDEFVNVTNTLTWSITSGTVADQTVNTYPTVIPPIMQDDERVLYVAASQFWVTDWTFEVWCSPFTTSGSIAVI